MKREPILSGGYVLIIEDDRGRAIETVYRRCRGGNPPAPGAISLTIELPTGVYSVHRIVMRDDPDQQTQDVFQTPHYFMRRVGAPVGLDEPKATAAARKGKLVSLPPRSIAPRASIDPDFNAIDGADVLPLGLVLPLVTIGYRVLVAHHEEQRDGFGELVRVEAHLYVDSSLSESLLTHSRRAKRLYGELAMRGESFDTARAARALDGATLAGAKVGVDAPRSAG